MYLNECMEYYVAKFLLWSEIRPQEATFPLLFKQFSVFPELRCSL